MTLVTYDSIQRSWPEIYLAMTWLKPKFSVLWTAAVQLRCLEEDSRKFRRQFSESSTTCAELRCVDCAAASPSPPPYESLHAQHHSITHRVGWLVEQGLVFHSTQFRSFRRRCFYSSDDPTNSVKAPNEGG